MGIHFPDLFSAAQSSIEAARGAENKIAISDRHKAEMAALVERHTQEKADNAAATAAAIASYNDLIAKLSADAGSTKKAIEDMVSRQAALLIEAQVELNSALPGDDGDASEDGEASPSTAGSIATASTVAPYTGKRRGRKSNAEKAAEAAAALAAAGEAAPADGDSPNAVLTPAAEPDGELDAAEAETVDAKLEPSLDADPEATNDDASISGIEENAPSTELADANQEANDGFEAAEVTATIVDTLDAPEGEPEALDSDGFAESFEVAEAAVVQGDIVTEQNDASPNAEAIDDGFAAATSDGNSVEAENDGFAPAAAVEPGAAVEEELDGFAELDKWSGGTSNTSADANDEEFELPAFAR
jgi:hypothetical protein